MIIKNISIQNFKNIENLEMDFSSNSAGASKDLAKGYFKEIGKGKVLPQVNAIIGPNAVGKTNIFSALSFLDWSTSPTINKNAAKHVLISKVVDKANMNEDDLEIDGFLDSLNNGEITKEDMDLFFEEKSRVIENLYTRTAKDNNLPIVVSAAFWDSEEAKEFVVSVELTKTGLTAMKPEHIFFKTKWTFNFDQTKFNISNLLSRSSEFYDMMLNELVEKIGTDKLLKIISLADASITHVFKKEKKILFRKTGSDIDMDFNSFSSGTKRTIYIYSFLLKSIDDLTGIFLIDEIELFLHRELALAIIDTMNMLSVKNSNCSFIFSTHNPLLLGENIKFKQVQEIRLDTLSGKHSSTKLSTLFKSHESLESKYKKGIISKYPSSSIVFDTIYDIVND